MKRYPSDDCCKYSPYARGFSTLQPEGAGEDRLLEEELWEEGRATIEALLKKWPSTVAEPDRKEDGV